MLTMSHTVDVANQEAFMTKTGVRGFAGDRAWSKTDHRDMFVQQFEYAKNAIRWAEYQKAVEKMKPLLSYAELKVSSPTTSST